MTQTELIHEIARHTGESQRTISNRGFTLLVPELPEDNDREPFVVDWDRTQASRQIPLTLYRSSRILNPEWA
ncbi:hypothetical protein Pla110_43900 [Polystyrenella longa]|uniref:Uncharacterized protein n=1 Tax=Polystyrenella longa TaxID=2528007 RepID=A0A518CTS7_9PLAN|nr:hypothetical protein [Polystyrenella longa]QDU82629.1 hypothetical protein Pla110_43900 [Polystyrenella longa]